MKRTAQEYFTKGLRLCKENQFDKAISTLSKVLEIESHHLDARYNRAKAYFKLGNLPPAIEDFSNLINLQPKVAFYFSERAVAYHLANKRGEALADLDKAVELEPLKAFRYASRAFIKDHYGDHEGALQDYNKAIELDPEDAISHNNKGLVEEKLGYIERSKQSFKKADELDPNYKEPTEASSVSRSLETKPGITGSKSSAVKTSKADAFFGTVKSLITSSDERKAFINFIKRFGRSD